MSLRCYFAVEAANVHRHIATEFDGEKGIVVVGRYRESCFPPSLIPRPIQIPHIHHPQLLFIAKIRIARIAAIIHEIMHRVRAGAIWAAILRVAFQRRATIGTSALLRRIIDEVARVGRIAALTHEGVQQTEPVADFVHGRFALLIAIEPVVGHRGGEHVAAVVDVGALRLGEFLALAAGGAVCRWAGGGCVGDVRGQRAVAEKRGGHGARGGGRGEIGLEVDVQGGVIAFAERCFHGLVVQVSCPRVVDSVGVWLCAEGDVEGRVGCIEDVGLIGDEAGDLV